MNEKENNPAYIDDQRLDHLFELSAERRLLSEEIASQVMQELKSNEWKRLWRKWRCPVLFALGLPLVVLLFAWLLMIGWQDEYMGPCHALIVIPIVAMAGASIYALCQFTLSQEP